jgi:RNA recognition motif. (a.k.a. RRM, RBD, or RNP domain)
VNSLQVPAALTLLVQFYDVPVDQQRFSIKTVRQDVTVSHSGPQTLLCELQDFNLDPRGHFAICVRSSNDSLTLLTELRPVFNLNQLYVTLDLKPQLTKDQKLKLAAGTVVGSCVVVSCPELYPIYCRPRRPVALRIAQKVIVPPQKDAVVSLRLNNVHDMSDAFPIITIKEHQSVKFAELKFKVPVLSWDKDRQNVGYKVQVHNSTRSAIQLEEGSIVHAICCMYDKKTKFEGKEGKVFKSEHVAVPIPLLTTKDVKPKTEAGANNSSKRESTEYIEPDDEMIPSGHFEYYSSSINSNSVVSVKQEHQVIQENPALPVSAMDELDSFEVKIFSIAEVCLSPLASIKVLFQLQDHHAKYFSQLKHKIQVSSQQKLAESLVVDEQTCLRVGNRILVKVRNVNEHLCITIDKKQPLTVCIVVEQARVDCLGPSLTSDGLTAGVLKESLIEAASQQVVEFLISDKDVATVEILEQLLDDKFRIQKQIRPVVNCRFFASVFNTQNTQAHFSGKISVARIRKISTTGPDNMAAQFSSLESNGVEVLISSLKSSDVIKKSCFSSVQRNFSTVPVPEPEPVSTLLNHDSHEASVNTTGTYTDIGTTSKITQNCLPEKAFHIPYGSQSPFKAKSERSFSRSSSESSFSMASASSGPHSRNGSNNSSPSKIIAYDISPSKIIANDCLSKDGQLVLQANPVASVRLQPGSTTVVPFLIEQEHSVTWENFKNLGLIKMHTFSKNIVIPLQTAAVDISTGGFSLKVHNNGPKAEDLFQFVSVSVAFNPNEVPIPRGASPPSVMTNAQISIIKTEKDDLFTDERKNESFGNVGLDTTTSSMDALSVSIRKTENDDLITDERKIEESFGYVGLDASTSSMDALSVSITKTENDDLINDERKIEESFGYVGLDTTITTGSMDALSVSITKTENDDLITDESKIEESFGYVGLDASTGSMDALSVSIKKTENDSLITDERKNESFGYVGLDTSTSSMDALPVSITKTEKDDLITDERKIEESFEYVGLDTTTTTCCMAALSGDEGNLSNCDEVLSQSSEAESSGGSLAEDSIYVGNLPVGCTVEKLKWLFDSIHPVQAVEIKTGWKTRKQFAHVKFKSPSALDVVSKSILSLSGKRLVIRHWKGLSDSESPEAISKQSARKDSGSETLNASCGNRQAKVIETDIWIGGLPFTEGNDRKEMQAGLEQILTHFGPVNSIEIRKNRNHESCHAVASFTTKEAAKAAIEQKSIGFRQCCGAGRAATFCWSRI